MVSSYILVRKSSQETNRETPSEVKFNNLSSLKVLFFHQQQQQKKESIFFSGLNAKFVILLHADETEIAKRKLK